MISDSVLLSLQRATHRTLHALTTTLTHDAALDLTPSEINCLANLADQRPRSVRDLADDTGTRTTTLTGVLDRLERRGHVTRELDPTDRRSFRITLTASGRAVARKIGAAITDLETTALAGVSARQLAGYHAVIAALQEIP